jgi:hypothetical protein
MATLSAPPRDDIFAQPVEAELKPVRTVEDVIDDVDERPRG